MFQPYDFVSQPFEVIHEDFPYRRKGGGRLSQGHRHFVRAGESLVLSEAVGTIGSDVISVAGSFYVDLNSFPGAHVNDPISDSGLLAIHKSRKWAAVRKANTRALRREPEEAIWLGQPMLGSWGHFVYEGLLRLELIELSGVKPGVTVIVSDAVPEAFIDVARFVFPSRSFERVQEGTAMAFETLHYAPLRTFHTHNMFFSRSGENFRLNGEYQLFDALKSRVSGLFPNLASPARRIFIDRRLSNYRKSRNATSLRAIAENNGFEVIDPGALDARMQLEMFLSARSLWGQTGSGFFLAPLAPRGARVLMVGSDFSHDWEGLAEAIRRLSGHRVSLVTGKRDFIARGYSEPLYHQDFELSEAAFTAIEDWCQRN